MVQWQDGLGSWRDVDGWRGEVEDDHVLWFVPPELFGAGPFRWVVYADPVGSDTLGTSGSFDLSDEKGETVYVLVMVE